MFVDTKREGEVQVPPDLRSIYTFISWLETKDPGEEYCFTRSWECALGQYRMAHGEEAYVPAMETSSYFGREDIYLIQGMPRTFGALLQRARRYAIGQSNRGY